MTPFRKLHHQRKRMVAAQWIAARRGIITLANEAGQMIEKIDGLHRAVTFNGRFLEADGPWLSAHVGASGWLPLWDRIAESAHRVAKQRKGVAA